jgi:hypothetical protein
MASDLRQQKIAKAKIAAIARELDRRQGYKETIKLLMSRLFDKQKEVIIDESKWKSVLCSRRSGKSVTAAAYLIKVCLETANVKTAYIGLTKTSAVNTMKKVFEKLLRDSDVSYEYNKSDGIYEFENESTIMLLGVEQSDKEIEKLRGQSFACVIIDECQSYRVFDIKDAVTEVISPACIDHEGTIVLMGTASNDLTSYFCGATTPGDGSDTDKFRKFTKFKWFGYENPFIAKGWIKWVEDQKADDPDVIHTPAFKQEIMCEWVAETDKSVYRYTTDNNILEMPKNTYSYVLGVDTGYKDATSFVMLAYTDNDPVLYVPYVFKQAKLDITDMANKIKELNDKYQFERIVIDGSNAQAVAEMRNRHSLPLESVDKSSRSKAEFIDIVNSDLRRGLIKMLMPDCEALAKEMCNLIWVDRGDGRKENPSQQNHACDAFIYAHRYVYHYAAREGTVERQRTIVEETEDMIRRMRERREAQNEVNWWEKEY